MKKKTFLLMLVLMFITTNALSQNLIQGQITGGVKADINVELYKTTCGDEELVETITTNAEGYYGFGCLDDGIYRVVPDNASYIFNPEFDNVQIPQTVIQSYDFNSTFIPCASVDRFVDNNDGTVTDCRTDLVWLKNANCFGLRIWSDAITAINGFNSGHCGLTDGTIDGNWRLATKEELQGIGTDPPTTWYSGYPSATWTKPGSPFVNVQSYPYWSSTEYNTSDAWFVDMFNGQAVNVPKALNAYVWPVRSYN
jgi:hypothetical protein